MNTIAIIHIHGDRSVGVPDGEIAIDFGVTLTMDAVARDELRTTVKNFAYDFLGDDAFSVVFNDECELCGHLQHAGRCTYARCPTNAEEN